ncbi:MAG: hypothetical protein AB7O73_03925 [Bacteroidia bacterium]
MINKKTTLILGAGASQPYGFPSGRQLVEDIYNGLKYTRFRESSLSPFTKGREIDNDQLSSNPFVQILLDYGFTKTDIENFRQSLMKSQFNSIDLFLEHRRDFLDIGKMSIAYTLLKHENPNKILNLDSNWYRSLWNKLNTSFEDFKNNQLKIITFNYDRSLEYYLFQAIKHAFGREEALSLFLFESIEIIHLHGLLGNLYTNTGSLTKTEFGEVVTEPNRLLEISKNIRIIHEEDGQSNEFNKAIELLEDSNKIFILGFGYGATNIKRLKIKELNIDFKIVGTGTGMTSMELQKARLLLGDRQNFVIHGNLDCLNLMRNISFE